MKFALHITAPPYSCQAHHCALKFAEAVADSEHSLFRVFFSGDGVYIGNRLMVSPQGEVDLKARWQQLAEQTGCELILCVSASLQRGILDNAEADRYEKPVYTTEPPFVISGLGQLVEAGIEADRLVTFGD